MSKCTKVKHPCKICLESVNRRTGLQCQGACQSWVHYTCLNYTPGKVRDIKKGVIKVTCPCPDCKTIMPKEYRTDQPFSCTNALCPANRPPKCENPRCPINDSERKAVPHVTCPLSSCGTSCKKHATPQLPYVNIPLPPMQPCVPIPIQQHRSGNMDVCYNPGACTSGCSDPPSPKRESLGDCCPPRCASPNNGVEDMCNAIGLLACQLNELMRKMQNHPC